MRHQIEFDLHFTDTAVYPQTATGRFFVAQRCGVTVPESKLYVAALEAGLKVSFETAAIRDRLSSIQIKETI